MLLHELLNVIKLKDLKKLKKLKIGCRQTQVSSLPSRNKTFVIKIKNFAKADSRYLLLSGFAWFPYFVRFCLIFFTMWNILSAIVVMIICIFFILYILTLFRMSIFGAARGWGGKQKRPLFPKICHTYPMWNIGWNVAQLCLT